MKQREHSKGITERAMDHMPKMKDPLRLIEKYHAFREGRLLPDQADNALNFFIPA